MKIRETLSAAEAAAICHLKRVAIHAAIRKGNLKAAKVANKWQITLSALDEYRKNKYSRMKLCHEGKRIYDIEAGRWPIQFVSKWLSELIGRTISENRVYYLIKTGRLPAYRQGKTWVIKREDAEELYNKIVKGEEGRKEQMRFA